MDKPVNSKRRREFRDNVEERTARDKSALAGPLRARHYAKLAAEVAAEVAAASAKRDIKEP